MAKKEYTSPILETVTSELADVITASEGGVIELPVIPASTRRSETYDI